MADVSVDILERVALGTIALVSGICAWGFRFLNGKSDKLDDSLTKKIDKLEADLDNDVLTLHKRLDESERNILKAISDSGDKTVSVGHCNAKQELWVVKTSADRDANNKEHTMLIDTIAGLKDAVKLVGDSQVVSSRQVADELKEVQECVKKLTKGLECD